MKSPRRVAVQLSGKDKRRIAEFLSKGVQPVRVPYTWNAKGEDILRKIQHAKRALPV